MRPIRIVYWHNVVYRFWQWAKQRRSDWRRSVCWALGCKIDTEIKDSRLRMNDASVKFAKHSCSRCGRNFPALASHRGVSGPISIDPRAEEEAA